MCWSTGIFRSSHDCTILKKPLFLCPLCRFVFLFIHTQRHIYMLVCIYCNAIVFLWFGKEDRKIFVTKAKFYLYCLHMYSLHQQIESWKIKRRLAQHSKELLTENYRSLTVTVQLKFIYQSPYLILYHIFLSWFFLWKGGSFSS